MKKVNKRTEYVMGVIKTHVRTYIDRKASVKMDEDGKASLVYNLYDSVKRRFTKKGVSEEECYRIFHELYPQ